MKEELFLVEEFHKKFQVPILEKPDLASLERLSFRHKLMAGEVEEYLEGARNGDLENVAKELADILYAVYGTILEHGLQDKMEEVFKKVHKSNMSKDYHEYKMTKGTGYFKADIKKILNDK